MAVGFGTTERQQAFLQWKREREQKTSEEREAKAFASRQRGIQQQTRSPSLQHYFQNQSQYTSSNSNNNNNNNNQVPEDFFSPLRPDADVKNEQQKTRPSGFFQRAKQALGSIQESNQEEEEEEPTNNRIRNRQDLFQGYYGNQKPNMFREQISRSISNSTLSANSVGFGTSANSPHPFSEEISFSPPLTPAESQGSTPLSTASSTIRKAFGSFTSAFIGGTSRSDQPSASASASLPSNRSGFSMSSSTTTTAQCQTSDVGTNASFSPLAVKPNVIVNKTTFPLWSKVIIVICFTIGLSGFFIREILEIAGPYAGISLSSAESEKMKVRLELLQEEIRSFQEVAQQVEEHSKKVLDDVISHVNKMKETREQEQIVLTTGIDQIKHEVIDYTVQIVHETTIEEADEIIQKKQQIVKNPKEQQQQQQQQQKASHVPSQQQAPHVPSQQEQRKKQTITDALDLAAEVALEQFLSIENLDTLNDLDFNLKPISRNIEEEEAIVAVKTSAVGETDSRPQVDESTSSKTKQSTTEEGAKPTSTSTENTTTAPSTIGRFFKKLQVVMVLFIAFTTALLMYDDNLRRDLKRRFFTSVSQPPRNRGRFARTYDSTEVETVRNSFSDYSETEDSATAEDDDIHNTTFIADLDDDDDDTVLVPPLRVDTSNYQRYNNTAYGREAPRRNSSTTGQVPVRRSRRVIERTPPRF